MKRLWMSLFLLVGLLAACQSSNPREVLYEEDFAKSGNGAWQLKDDPAARMLLVDGAYQFRVFEPDGFYWSRTGRYFTDMVVQVDVTKVSGPNITEFGIVCRYVDDSAFYFMVIDADGYYGIARMDFGSPTLLGQEQMQQDGKGIIKTGDATNRIEASCVGKRLALSVNGVELLAVEDDTYPGGDAGLIVGTYNPTGTDLRFDNFYVYKP